MSFKLNDKPKYQPWNEEEFNADIYVRSMNCFERWAYRTLCQSMFFHTTRPYLPADDEILWVLAGCESMEQWLKCKEKVIKRFSPVKSNPELLENSRVSADWEEMTKIRKKYSKMGSKSGLARLKGSTVSERRFNAGSTKSDNALNLNPTREVKRSKGKRREEKEREVSFPLSNKSPLASSQEYPKFSPEEV